MDVASKTRLETLNVLNVIVDNWDELAGDVLTSRQELPKRRDASQQKKNVITENILVQNRAKRFFECDKCNTESASTATTEATQTTTDFRQQTADPQSGEIATHKNTYLWLFIVQ